jgi:peptide/nickel transport system ATP-binding protein
MKMEGRPMSIIEVRQLSFDYAPHDAGSIENWTLRNLDFSMAPGGTLGIVGESGSGKSTLVRILCGLLPVSKGSVKVAGTDISSACANHLRDFRKKIQMVYQNPKRSFDPRMKVGLSLSQPVRALERRTPTRAELDLWVDRVGLNASFLDRFPHELSGGQLQRVAIARALSVNPEILLADEPTSALDVSVQAQVLNLIMELREELNLTMVLVSHDLAVVSRITDTLIVLNKGAIVEKGDTRKVLRSPRNAYTEKLMDAARAVSL